MITIGYPVNTHKETVSQGFVLTKRCFKVGELGEYLSCLRSQDRIAGARLLSDLNIKLYSLFPLFNIMFFIAFGMSIVFCLLILIQMQSNKSKEK